MVSKGQFLGQFMEHPTRSRRVVGSNPIWGSDFFRVLQTFNLSLFSKIGQNDIFTRLSLLLTKTYFFPFWIQNDSMV